MDMAKMGLVKKIAGFNGLLFIASFSFAYQTVGWGGFDTVLAEPWGLVTIADFMLGGVCFALIIFTFESDWRVALIWSLPIFVLSNLVTVAWIIFRFHPLLASFAKRQVNGEAD